MGNAQIFPLILGERPSKAIEHQGDKFFDDRQGGPEFMGDTGDKDGAA